MTNLYFLFCNYVKENQLSKLAKKVEEEKDKATTSSTKGVVIKEK